MCYRRRLFALRRRIASNNMRCLRCVVLTLSMVLLAAGAIAAAGDMSAAGKENVLLPDAKSFPFWNDRTVYRNVYHVANQNAGASDANPGTLERPWKTINRAAETLQPGEKVIVHGGTYRECVAPRRGGAGPDRMIAYEAAQGEKVIVTGAAAWRPRCAPSAGWDLHGKRATIWMADLPVEAFVGYNPFAARNIHEEFVQYRHLDDAPKYLLRRGAVFVDDRPLTQVFRYAELADRDGGFWVEEPGLRVHFRLPGDADPAKGAFEVTAREQVFAPQQRGLGYIRVSGFHFERAADGVPVPQRAMVSTNRGHHWIIEHNRVRWANACGIDVGIQDWKASPPPGEFGRHIIRANHISDCGVCGIAGCRNVDETLVEDNLVERIGGLGIEQMWEVAGLKFHEAHRVLIRRNTFADHDRASGAWLDYLNSNCRITGNLFRNISSYNGAILVEVSHAANMVDHNVFWDIRLNPGGGLSGNNGSAVDGSSSDHTVVANNFFGRVQGFAVSLNNLQADRVVGGRKGECRGNKALNNVFFACPNRVFLGRSEDNTSDGNLFDAGDKDAGFEIQGAKPKARVSLDAWRQVFGQDRNSKESVMRAAFDAKTNQLQFSCSAFPERGLPTPQMEAYGNSPLPGPFGAEALLKLREGKPAVLLLQRP